ncbi:MAG: DegT/DnrJ/EryC1/StrS family aminotransferase [Armatimonadota bacterium]|nr:DegT/DnrJ/EryC1/StrS family aminotransferase [Armatimonadota bacterium]
MIPIARPIITEEEKARILAILESGRLAAGEEVQEFERRFAEYVGVRFAVATSSGSTALQVALEALGIGPGDQVITTPFTFVATSNAILHCGAEPVFVDVDPFTFNIDPNAIEDALRTHPRVRALLIVHLFGLPCDMESIGELVSRHELLLVEDCAQAHGAEFRGRKVGSFGHVAIFSFYPTKNLTTGEGGMVVTSDPEVARKARLLVNVGMDGENYRYEAVGYNFRMTNLAAAMGLVQLGHLEARNEARRRNAKVLTEELGDLPWLLLPQEPQGYRHVYNQYTLRVPERRDDLLRYLQAMGIGCRVYYPEVIPRTPAYQKLGFTGRFPRAERLTQEVLSIPVHPALSPEELQAVITAIRAFSPAGGRGK